MDTQNRIWHLLTRKLANEATNEELCELDQLLKQYPDIHNKVIRLMEWWFDEHTSESDNFLFEKVLKHIEGSNHTAN